MEVAILFIIFGSITIWRFMSMHHKERMLQLQMGRGPDGKSAPDGSAQLALAAATQEMETRLRHLETIVTSVDFELNAKLNRLASHQLQLGEAATRALPIGSPARSEVHTPLYALQNGQKLADRFVVERPLGTGGMGAVYLARDEKLGERVALKILHGMALLDPSSAERLRREASAARRVSHVNVVKIHDIGEDQGHLFLSMEYVEGISLKDLIHKHGTLPLAKIREILVGICQGLAAAHAQGVIHRDLKPGNVLVMPNQQIKIIDFGLARVANLEGMTTTGMLLGTPEYMAPEQIKGGSIDARTDIYALGALTYHALTGRPPFTGDTPIAVSLAQATEEPVPPSRLRAGLDQAWDAFVAKAMSKNREQRFESAIEVEASLPG
ncbi:serine/threonine-protein kinase [Nannocystaceae bacterium ST9]